MVRKFVILLVLLTPISLLAQKKAITHDDYDLWKRISDVKISNKGKLVVSTIETSTKRGDGYIEIYNTKNKQKFVFHNGYNSSITSDESFVIFKRKPNYETLRKEKKKEVDKEDRSKDALFIYDVKNNKILDSILRVKKYKIPIKGKDWLVIEKFKNKSTSKKKKEKDSLQEKKKDTTKKKIPLAKKQNYALVYNLKTKNTDTLHQIKDFVVPEKGNFFYYALKNQKKNEKDLGVYQYDLSLGAKKVVDTGKYRYDKLVVDKEGFRFSFLAASDSTAVDSLKYGLYYYKNQKLKNLIDTVSNNLRNRWVLSADQSPFFSEYGKRLYFYSKPKVEYKRDTTLLEEEIPQVDVWNWQDKMIQPEQKSRFEELNKKAFISYYDTDKDDFIHIQDEVISEVIFDKDKEQQFVFGSTGSPYDIQRSWNLPWTNDYYLINTYTGERNLVLKNMAIDPILSPDKTYALYYDIQKQAWFSVNLLTSKILNLTKELSVAFYDEDDDHPALPYPYGYGGFDAEGNALVFDKFDIWRIALDGKKKPQNITKTGRKNAIEYRTLRLDPENRMNASYLNDELLITSFDKTTKASGLYALDKGKLVEKIKPSEFLINRYNKAKNAEIFTYQKQNFNTFQDMHLSNDGFKNNTQITNANPHQKDFKWGTAELFSWKAYDGKKLEGIIYKPEDFDPAKKYPLITYFYEKRSDSYRTYHIPRPSASIVNSSYLVSNDYIMFVPDIVYDEGKPGASAYNCIVSGVEAVEELGYIDSNNMAIQGQSWGGYQVAYLITVTNKFKTAMAGAPVSNMTSAYGGIRWQSGLSRAFQYEKSQSRIGKNLWEGFDLYIENSPLFGIPKIETPLLMMHNDKDGAVPYYQGIEMFMGMRRLQKPVWLLVYNNEAHNLRKEKNKQDLSIRMMQFFDHYLKGEPAPVWMTKGVPRIQKGKDFGYDLEEVQKPNITPSSNE
ncbi:alpha/beta hydrolase family protein [Aquimarina sp. 2201CG5-10]|uniref:alpha/beta hydrolase family protein n=1 Tax=Aquimarina callyspongiae TaxID=3098150 RepID=UPI002AB494FE|nr:prolyl oligopeptidase family serine peptidase [Aquimarina sp. 2201CG5-10]MDY8135079.1 prolyl oligopeptidase family serine peptidase [Aquimarina sp. 2201CG5-10]